MALVQVSVRAGSLSREQKAALVAKVTDAGLQAEGVLQARPFAGVHINEAPYGGWGMGGQAIPLEQMKAALGARG